MNAVLDANPTAPPLRPPAEARRRVDRLLYDRERRERRSIDLAGEFAVLNEYLAIAGDVTVALEQLSEQLFEQLLKVVQEKLTIALQEILDQPIEFKAKAGFSRGAPTVEFWIERGGCQEDVLRGQGGRVANVLSVGLRMFALTTLDESRHRRFLVLDEQDCWLRPDLVPKLVKIVHAAGQALGFQVLMISHHDVSIFEQYADRIYSLAPDGQGGVSVELWSPKAVEPDAE